MNPRLFQKSSRRSFLQTTALAAAGGFVFPRFAIGKADVAAGRKLNVACVGIGNMGSAAVGDSQRENIVALCDVDWRPAAQFGGSRVPLDIAARHPQAKRFTDFRKMLDQLGKEIDAVMVSTADHAHFSVGLAAMQMGKHVFIQKPLAHNIWQARTLRKAMHRYQVQTVMGNQGHCGENIRCIVEWVSCGILGDVTEVHCWTDRPCAPWFIKPSSVPPQPAPVPEGLDWDLWQGQAAPREYSPDYLPQKWRGWWDYGCGGLGDIGCHVLDTPFWALDLGHPSRIEVVQLNGRDNAIYTPWGAHLIYHFPARGSKPPVELHWWEGSLQPLPLPGMKQMPSNGMYMKGTSETLFAEDMRPKDPTLWPRDRMNDYAKQMERQTLPRVSGGPIAELFRAIKGDGPTPGSNFDYAAPLTEIVLLGAMAIRSGKSLAWDSETMRVTNLPEANAWVKEAARDGWAYGEDLWKI